VAKLTLSSLDIPSADLGPENPHAPLYQPFAPVATYEGEEVSVDHSLPYRMQDGYDRRLSLRRHRVAILESDRLTATFLLDLGGKLRSLVHKPSGRDLVFVNPVFQPANFAIRNAWCSGGVEWNVGIFGHCVFTCSPVFAARTVAPDGGDGLRIWEFERTRSVVWQVDFWAPEGSDFLFWSPRIVNPHDEATPMYWWTNLTVAEEPGGRVLAPARFAIEADHENGDALIRRDLANEPDLTYPQRRDLPRDTYFEIPSEERPWIAHVSAGASGVVHVSSPRLFGRKQWVWGMEEGGRRWQEWLNPGAAYIELQAGLTKRQSEYVTMPAKADWQWLEAFGPADGVDASDWGRAVDRVRALLVPPAEFDGKEGLMREMARRLPTEIVHMGSGWGALEAARRTVLGIGPFSGAETPFPAETIYSDQAPWMRALSASPPYDEPQSEPGSYVGPEWRSILEREPNSWLKWLHLGVIAWQEGERKQARRAWERSLGEEPNGWAMRNLAMLDRLDGDHGGACAKILEAHRLLPDDPNLADEVCRICSDARDDDSLASVVDGFDASLRRRPRVRLAAAQVALHRGDFDSVADFFQSPCDLVDIREAETTISDLWRVLCEQEPARGEPGAPPGDWDFRMRH